MTLNARFRRDATGTMLCRTLDDITLYFHRPSGQTHMVISPVPEILAQMDDGAALSVADIHDRLAQDFDLGDRSAAMADIAAHVETLVSLGLVRPA